MEQILMNISDTKTLFMICGIFIIGDIFTGYLKAFKYKKINSSISRDGYIKKVGWAVALLIGYLIDELVGASIFLMSSVIVCVITEGISFYENLGNIGVNIPYKKYFEKIQNVEDKK